jgi:chemotaxis protein MotB
MSSKGKSPLGGHEEEHENSERWLLTYSDMITLLVAFFIMLYSMSVMNMAKFQRLAVSVKSGFNGESKGGGGASIVDKGQVNALDSASATEPMSNVARSVAPLIEVGENRNEAFPKQDTLADVKATVEKMIQKDGFEGMLKIKKTSSGYAVTMVGDGVFFGPDSADLTEKAKSALLRLAAALNALEGKVSVEGYTTGVSAHSIYKSRWDLASARSLNVVRVFAGEGGVDPTRLSATGFGERLPKDQPEDGDFVRILIRR